MTGRAPIRHGLTLLLAALQLASPAVTAVADALLVARSGQPVAHVESTSASGCPAVHSADCAVCRYLSIAASIPRATFDLSAMIEVSDPRLFHQRDGSGSIVFLPDGRAPPSA